MLRLSKCLHNVYLPNGFCYINHKLRIGQSTRMLRMWNKFVAASSMDYLFYGTNDSLWSLKKYWEKKRLFLAHSAFYEWNCYEKYAYKFLTAFDHRQTIFHCVFFSFFSFTYMSLSLTNFDYSILIWYIDTWLLQLTRTPTRTHSRFTCINLDMFV